MNMTEKELNNLLSGLRDKLMSILGGKLVKLILYGSYANKTFDAESDVDVMVLTKQSSIEIKKIDDSINKLALELSLEYDILVSIFIKPVDEFYKFSSVIPFYKNVIEHGVTYYE